MACSNDMRKLLLVKHSLPEVTPLLPASQWPLGEKGRRLCAPLALRLAEYQPACIAASVEPKAMATAEAVADHLRMRFGIVEGLQEHDRSNMPFLETAEFEAAVSAFLERPKELILGQETAVEARDRFCATVERMLARCVTGNVVIVAHGTVIALFAAHRAGIEPFALWRRLGLPSFAVFSLPGLELLEVVENVE